MGKCDRVQSRRDAMFIETPVIEHRSPSGAECSLSFISMVAFTGRLSRTQTFRPAGALDFYRGTVAIDILSLRDSASRDRSCQHEMPPSSVERFRVDPELPESAIDFPSSRCCKSLSFPQPKSDGPR